MQVASDALHRRDQPADPLRLVTCLTVEQLRKIWEPGSTVDNWRRSTPRFPICPAAVRQPRLGNLQVLHARHQRRARGEPDGFPHDRRPPRHGGGRRRRAGRARLLRLLVLPAEPGTAVRARDRRRKRLRGPVRGVGSRRVVPPARPLALHLRQPGHARREPGLRSFVRYVLENARPIADEALFVPLMSRSGRRRCGSSWTRSAASPFSRLSQELHHPGARRPGPARETGGMTTRIFSMLSIFARPGPARLRGRLWWRRRRGRRRRRHHCRRLEHGRPLRHQGRGGLQGRRGRRRHGRHIGHGRRLRALLRR